MAFNRDTISNGNICVIWIDDLIDVHTWRNTFGLTIQTPNLDRLLGQGVRFSNAYATIPLCAPCRAELATGISPFRSGLVDLNRIWREAMPPTAGWQFDFRRAGFKTFQTGKVDGHYRPMAAEYKRLLFHEEAAAKTRGGWPGEHRYGAGPGVMGTNHPNDDGSTDSYFYDYSVAQNAIEYLERLDPTRRHLMQVGFKHPHYDLTCPDRFYQQYDVSKIEWPSIAAPEDYFGPQPGTSVYETSYIANGNWTPEKAGDEAWRQVVRGYFAAISHVDHEIGRFFDALSASKIAENTTVILLSDNGFNLGNHDSFHKMSQWDSAAHVPLGLWHNALQDQARVIDLPVSLHNLPKTVFDLAGLQARRHWTSGQSLLPLIDKSFGEFDRTKSPITAVFGTLSVRPSTEGLTQYRYFRYPNGDEHVYDLVADPGETQNICDTAPIEILRQELVDGALELGLDLRGFENPKDGVNAMMATDGTVMLEGGAGDTDYWAYGADAEKVKEEKFGGKDTLWYMGGPNDFVLHAPANVEKIRIGTVVARPEEAPDTPRHTLPGRKIRVVGHPNTPMHFETSERVEVDVRGSMGDDVMLGAVYAPSTFYGGAGNDTLMAVSPKKKVKHKFFGGSGNDTLVGGFGPDYLDGGTGDDVIRGGSNHNVLIAGHGNDRIFDGADGSEIHTGPGRNMVRSVGGDDVIHVGPGRNDIQTGMGAVKFILSYGAIVTINSWFQDYSLDLSAWPKKPHVRQFNGGVELTCGLSALVVKAIEDPAVIEASICGRGWEECA